HVITANKGPVVYHYRRLAEIARTKRLGFRFEGTVMDGAPVFSLFLEAMRGARIESFEGILNSTSNLILSEIEAGRTYEEGVAAARAIGFLETDPSMDLDGWDATVKACLLANVLMGGSLRPEEVPRQGVLSVDPAAVLVRAVRRAVRLPRWPSLPRITLTSCAPDARWMRFVLGGSFDILHDGHEALLRAAFAGRPAFVLIGLTTDRFARESRTRVN